MSSVYYDAIEASSINQIYTLIFLFFLFFAY